MALTRKEKKEQKMRLVAEKLKREHNIRDCFIRIDRCNEAGLLFFLSFTIRIFAK